MRRDEVEAVAVEYETLAKEARQRADAMRHTRIGDIARAHGEADARDECAAMLRAAFAQSEAPPVGMSTPDAEICPECGAWVCEHEAAPVPEPGTRTLLLPAKAAFEMTFSGVAMSTGIDIAAFGPGLWIVETVERSESDPKMAHVTAYPVSP